MSNQVYQPIYSASYVLAIGINEYSDPVFQPLGNAEQDANDFAGLLAGEPYGFQSRPLIGESASKAAVLDALYDLRNVEPDSRVIVFFAGHGYTLIDNFGHETGYLACTDTVPRRDYTALKLDEVMDLRRYSAAKHIAFIFDSCFSGKALGMTKLRSAADRFIERRAYQVLSAGAGDQAVSDLRSMTRLLLNALAPSSASDTLRLNAIGLAVQEQMAADTKSTQIPQFGHIDGSQGGDFVFYEPPQAQPIDLLSARLRRGLAHEDADMRFFAIERAEKLLWDPEHGPNIRAVLEDMQYDDPDRDVRRRAGDALRAAAPPVIKAPHPAPPIIESVPEPAPPEPQRYDFEPEMVLIPAGPFLMGSPTSDKLRYDNEPEQFQLDISYDYAVGRYPVTVGQYRVFIEAGGYREDRWWTQEGLKARAAGWDWIDSHWQETGKAWTTPRFWDDAKWAGDDLLPVVGVSWYESYAYTRWLSETTGREYRLLTESEWEKAARGGLQIPDGQGGMKKNPHPARTWPWGDEEPTKELCNFEGNVGQTSPVTSHEAQARRQPYGLYHMAGNVWEWCLSEWANPYTNPEGNDPGGSASRVVRGGSWIAINDLRYVRCSCRFRFDPLNWGNNYGFRVGGGVPVLK